MEYEKESAIFLPLKHSLWELRQATKHALLNHIPPKPFKILHEELYYPGIIDRHLKTPGALDNVLQPFEEMISGDENGVLNCIALIEIGTKQGIILHRHKGLFLVSLLPFLSYEEAYKEYQLMHDLIHLSEKDETARIYLNKTLQTGSYSLKELLQYISKCMN